MTILARHRAFHACACLLLAMALCILAPMARAKQSVPVDFSTRFINLRPVMQLVRTQDAKTVIALPAGAAGQSQEVTLSAHGKSSPHYWLVFSLGNISSRAAGLILQTALAEIAGAGFAPLSEPDIILSAGSTSGAQIVRTGASLFSLKAPPRTTASYFLEVAKPQIRLARLWHAKAYARAQGGNVFLAGMLAGICMLLVLSFMALYALRPMPALLAPALFTMGALGFVVINSGGWQALFPAAAGAGGLQRLEVFCEGLMLSGLTLWLVFWQDLLRRSRLLGGAGLMAAALFAGMSIWGLAVPAQAILAIRPLLWLMTVMALVIAIIRARGQQGTAGRGGIVFLAFLFIWAVFTALAAFGILQGTKVSLISAALVVLATLSWAGVMARAALSPAAALRRFFSGANRQALALAAAGLAVWDLDLSTEELHTGTGLEKALGLPPGTLAHGGKTSFMARMHPADVPVYQAAIDAAAHRGHGPFSVQFRLRRADGSYAWFLLRARPVGGTHSGGLPARLTGVLSDITRIKRSEERILSDAVRDRTTGLPNRPLLLDRLSRAIKRAQGSSASLYLMVLDIDRFRNINDAWGFEMGDALLRQVARRIGAMLEPEDTLARLPGDQFAIIADASARPRDIIAFAERLRAALARPFDLGMREISLTVCIGITHLRGSEEMEAEDALKQADIALFEARKRGQDAVAFFEKSMLTGRSKEVSLEQDLRRAVERGEIEVVYQPIMYLADGQLAGFEALVRWRHPLHGILGPDSFIPLAEEIGIIGDIGQVVLREAVRHLGVWQRAFRPARPLFAAVNISSAQLLNASLVDEIATLLNREGIAPETLKLELTESLILENPELGRKILERIAALGVRIACDDFGTGYSSLSNLRNLPFSTLKIDRAFIDTEDDQAAGIILESIILMAHGLGMDVVAEGIETEEQMRRLALLGCDMGQGWFIGQPVPARRVMEAFTGASLDLSAESRIKAFFNRLKRKSTGDDAGPPLILPSVPMPGAPGAAAESEEPEEKQESGEDRRRAPGEDGTMGEP